MLITTSDEFLFLRANNGTATETSRQNRSRARFWRQMRTPETHYSISPHPSRLFNFVYFNNNYRSEVKSIFNRTELLVIVTLFIPFSISSILEVWRIPVSNRIRLTAGAITVKTSPGSRHNKCNEPDRTFQITSPFTYTILNFKMFPNIHSGHGSVRKVRLRNAPRNG